MSKTWGETGATWFVEETGETKTWTPTERKAAAKKLRAEAAGSAGALDKAAAAAVAADARRILANEANTMRAIAARADEHSTGGAPAVEIKRAEVRAAAKLIQQWAGA